MVKISAGRDVDIGGDVVEGDKVAAGCDVMGQKNDTGKKKATVKWLTKFAVAVGLQGPLMVLIDWVQTLIDN